MTIGPINEHVITAQEIFVRWLEDVKSTIDNLRTHSTDEIEVGLDRYRKRVAITRTFVNTDATSIAHSITGLTAVHSITGVLKDTNYFPFPFTDATNVSSLHVTATNIVSDVSGTPAWTASLSGFIELEYSK
tara:strand:+ start:125 stop:520 length:396 start_codon:yes stop_codon:yes gene_type:complete